MKKTIATALGAFGAALAGIGIWYWTHTSRAQAEADEMDARQKSAKLVNVKFVVKPPAETPADQDLYLSGSAPTMGNWEAAGVRLERQADGTYGKTIELMTGVEYAFKVNRGSWGTVERGPNMADVENHRFSAAEGKPVEVVVAAWVDGGKGTGRVTLTGTVVTHPKIDSKLLNNVRDIAVYLPPGYDAADGEERRFPVLYMMDGQNLFNSATSFNTIEWQMDETAQRLIQANQVQPIIIVGVYNTEWRNAEFTPPGMKTNDPKNPEAKGDLYGRFLVEEVKPLIDQRYRTLSDRENTAIGGSAQGGLITLLVAKNHKDVFGKVALCSPWLRAPDGNAKVLPEYATGAWMKGTRWYVDVGTAGAGAGYPPFTTHENASNPQAAQNALADVRELVAAFDSNGLVRGSDYVYEEISGGEYNEPAWQKRVEPLLTALFKATGTPTTQPASSSR
jgi:enterochelin esterase-like enzyme